MDGFAEVGCFVVEEVVAQLLGDDPHGLEVHAAGEARSTAAGRGGSGAATVGGGPAMVLSSSSPSGVSTDASSAGWTRVVRPDGC